MYQYFVSIRFPSCLNIRVVGSTILSSFRMLALQYFGDFNNRIGSTLLPDYNRPWITIVSVLG